MNYSTYSVLLWHGWIGCFEIPINFKKGSYIKISLQEDIALNDEKGPHYTNTERANREIPDFLVNLSAHL